MKLRTRKKRYRRQARWMMNHIRRGYGHHTRWSITAQFMLVEPAPYIRFDDLIRAADGKALTLLLPRRHTGVT